MNRRAFLRQTTAFSLAGAGFAAGLPASELPAFGESFDREIKAFMGPRRIPGAALAVIKDGKLVYARGYGSCDREGTEPVIAASLFRIASISKPLTGVAVVNLATAGRLELDRPILDYVRLPGPGNLLAPEPADARWKAVTVRHCLHHTGGWDSRASGDPMFRSLEIARKLNIAAPAKPDAIIRFMLQQPLDFAPGTRYAYSNFGYCLLGRAIEAVTGDSYEQHVRKRLLEPIGIKGMRLGASLEANRAPGEVCYHMSRPHQVKAVFPECRDEVPPPYGSFCLEAMDAHGGWIASVVDLARFAAALEGHGPSILSKQTQCLLYEPPAPPVSRKPDGSLEDHYYGCGWSVRPVGKDGRANYWHNGSLPGTYGLLVRRFDGLGWAVLFNQRSEDPKLPDGAIDPALHRAADAVKAWPKHDLFT